MNNNMPDLTGIIIGDNGELLSLDNEQRTLTERLSAIDGVEVRGVSYIKTTYNARIAYNARDNEIWFSSDTFIGDSHVISEPLSEETIVELFSKW